MGSIERLDQEVFFWTIDGEVACIGCFISLLEERFA